jgi:hypothetical protein
MLNRSAVGEKALFPYQFHLSYGMLGLLYRTDWGKRAETWKMFWRSKFLLDDHFLLGKEDTTFGYEIGAFVCSSP